MQLKSEEIDMRMALFFFASKGISRETEEKDDEPTPQVLNTEV